MEWRFFFYANEGSEPMHIHCRKGDMEGKFWLDIDGRDYRFPLAKVSPRLLAASSAEREHFEISPSGYSIHWPAIDEDLSIDGLLGIRHRPSFLAQKVV